MSIRIVLVTALLPTPTPVRQRLPQPKSSIFPPSYSATLLGSPLLMAARISGAGRVAKLILQRGTSGRGTQVQLKGPAGNSSFDGRWMAENPTAQSP